MPEMNLTETIFSIPALVVRSTSERQVELMSILRNRHVLDPSILEERVPFFWDAEISSDLIDSHYTHMLPNTLANFRDDAITGVAALPAHQHYGLPYGRSVDALLENTVNPPRTRVIASFYTLPGLNLNGVKTDDLIDGLRSGILRDKSVGFFGGAHVCDVCGLDFWDFGCPHVPGIRYEIDKEGAKRLVTATFAVDNARLSEVSNVFDGSTPRAEVLKAEREVQEGRLKPEAASLIEQRYRVKLPAATRSFAGVEVVPATPGKDVEMEFEPRVREILSGAGLALTDDTAASVQLLAERLVAADKRTKELEPQAADGRQYRTDMVGEALAEGVRAYGQGFSKDTYEPMLTTAPLATIRQMRDDWKKVGDEHLPAGRQTVENDETPQAAPPLAPRPFVPASAFRA